MFNSSEIQTEFLGLVGLRQTNNPAFDELPDSIVKSSTNVLVQHPLLNIENLDMTARNYGAFDYDNWSGATTYDEGERVRGSDENVYESLADGNLNHNPTSTTGYWQVVSLLALYLEDVFRNSIDDVVNGFVNEKKMRREAKTLLDNVILYEGAGSKNDLVVNQGDLVGFAVQLKYSRNLISIIKRIGHQFTQTGPLTLYIYHSSQNEVVSTITITRTLAYSFEWSTQAINLRNVASTYDAGGTFFILYDQDQAPGQAIRKRHTWGTAPCATCSGFDRKQWNLYSRYMNISAVRIPASKRNTVEGSSYEPDELWDLNDTVYVQDTNYGLNLELMAKCDLTEMLIQHKDVFAFAIRDMVTVKLLENLSNSTRQNGVETIVSKQAMIALQDVTVGGGGYRKIAEKSIKAVDFEFSGFNDFCLPCNNAAGLNYGATSLNR